MKLRAIPPANRRSTARLSSMRIGAGLTLGQIGLQTNLQVDSSPTKFKPGVVKPNPQTQAQREAHNKALQTLAIQLETLIATAEPEEAQFWQQQLDRLRGMT